MKASMLFTSRNPTPGNLAWSTSSHFAEAMSIMARLMGTSLGVESTTEPSGRTPAPPRKAMSTRTWRRHDSVSTPTIDS
nr:hypothetical protein [Tessaracoccus coleopterorum]